MLLARKKNEPYYRGTGSKKNLPSILVISSILIGWSPWQEIALLFPSIASILLIIFLIVRQKGIPFSHLYDLLLYLWCILMITFLHMACDTYSLIHFSFWLVTHSSLLMIFHVRVLTPEEAAYGTKLFVKLYIITALIESVVALKQYYQNVSFQESAAAGDFIVGTLGNNSHLFAMKMIVAVIFAFILLKYKKKYRFLKLILLFLFMQVWLLASALHTIIIMLLSFLLYWLFLIKGGRVKYKMMLGIVLATLIIVGSLLLVQKSNIYYMGNKLSLNNLANPSGGLFGKIEFYYRTVFIVPTQESVFTSFLGFGPGSYSSRASWILSGNYLFSQGNIPVSTTRAWQIYLRDIWNTYLLSIYPWKKGVANEPFATWVSILGEFGIVGLIFSLFITIKILKKNKRKIILSTIKTGSSNSVIFANVSLFLFVLVVVSFLFDNWLEYPRLMVPLVLFFSLAYKGLDYNKRIASTGTL